MQNERIFFAPSLVEVIKQLLIYRPTGVLTIWRASGSGQEDARISIEQGRLLHVYWGSYNENANETILGWINSWGPIHFSFLATGSHLQLPAPGQTARQEQSSLSQSSVKRASSLERPAVTQPLQALPAATRPFDNSSVKAGIRQGKPSLGNKGQTQGLPEPDRQEERSNGAARGDPLSALAHETVIISHTSYGRVYSPSYLPRHDRTIFLLINGRRSVVDLSHLTKRSLEEVYKTLYRLQNLQLITFDALPKRAR
ncbi:MAG: hypothetical protein E6J33_03550 [Chloroflexi bacterium]|nr:MAG: hypothetical protein E6J33_03550 [Chloroflexota bacterium]